MQHDSHRVTTRWYETRLGTMAQFRCPTWHPVFSDSPPAGGYLIVFPRESVWIKQQGSPEVVANANVVMFYNRGQEYYRRAISQQGDRCDFYSVAPELVLESMRRFDQSLSEDDTRLFPFTHGLIGAELYREQRWFFERVRRGAYQGRELEWDQTLGQLVDKTIEQAFRSRGISQPPPSATALVAHRRLALSVQELIASSYCENLSLVHLAEVLGSSPFHLSRVFRQQTGITIHQYQTNLRLRASLERIDAGQTDLTGLALDLGFASHSHFSNSFRRAFSLTPSQWRRNLTADGN